ncbi:MAG: hypothetical protein LBM93_05945, partial [Oscillospiraceae bacterium]|nr:hypothetical protein [Oscillospiraceae bacterium]
VDAEELAVSAGLSLKIDSGFNEILIKTIDKKGIKPKEIITKSNTTERMFEYIKRGLLPTKQTLTAITISLGLELDEMQALLNKAGYALSKSLPNDMVILFELERRNYNVYLINEVLYELGLPMLGTKTVDSD